MQIKINKNSFRRLRIMSSILYHSSKYAIMNHTPFTKPIATLLSDKNADISWQFSKISKLMLDNYVTQFNGAACSVATAATVLNTLRMLIKDSSDPVPLTQHEILDAVKVIDWKERIVPTKHKNSRGVPIMELVIAVEGSLKQYNIPYDTVELVHLGQTQSSPTDEKETLFKRLVEFEQSGTNFIIAHFNQGILIPGMHIPHISPVGAFNTKDDEVLVLDVDKDGPGPYWVPFESFFEGLASDYGGKLKKYGYDTGGYVWITGVAKQRD